MPNLRLLFYKRYLQNPAGDIIGGLTAGVVALPLCLAFGVASGLGAAAGLYGAIAVGIMAATFGGTPAQCSGPTGPMTVIAASIASANPDRPELLFASCFVAGIMQIGMGYLKVGELIQYMPYPVISGFMTGIGTIIICIQIGPLFGLPSSGNVLSATQSWPKIVHSYNLDAFIIGALVIAIIYIFPRLTKRILVMALVLALTIFVDLIVAVLAGIAFASMIFVKQLADAKVSSVHSVEALDELSRHAAHIPQDVRKLIYTYQFNGPIFFGEAKNLAAAVESLSEAKYIILRFYNVPLIDQTGAFAVEHAITQWQAKGINVLLVGMQAPIRQTLDNAGVLNEVSARNCFDRYEDAIAAIDVAETPA